MRARQMWNKTVPTLAVMAMLALCAAAHAEPLLKAGDRMVFYGDSITEQRRYTRNVVDYFTLRYPGVDISFRNAGWTGDRVEQGMSRLDRDVLSLKPTVVSLCFGMNDGGNRAYDQEGYDRFMAGMTTIVERLTQAGVKVVLLTPGCVDPDRSKRPGTEVYNDTLSRYSKGVLELAAKNNLPVYNINALMLDVQTRAKADATTFTMIPDSIHPNEPGAAVMSFALLRALGCTDQASGLTIDAKSGKATPDRCTVKDLVAKEDSVTFTRTDQALPTYLAPAARTICKYIPFDKDFNQYLFTVKSLKKGNYALTVEGMAVGTFTADELAAGVNLGPLPGPWETLGEKVNALVVDQDNIYFHRWRNIGLARVPEEARPEFEALLAKLDVLIKAKETERLKATAGDRAWKWELRPAAEAGQ